MWVRLVNQDSELVTQQGYPIVPGIQIPLDASEVIIAEDGAVQVRYANSTDAVSIGQLDVVDFTNVNGLKALGGNLYGATAESGEPIPMEATDGLLLKRVLGRFERGHCRRAGQHDRPNVHSK